MKSKLTLALILSTAILCSCGGEVSAPISGENTAPVGEAADTETEVVTEAAAPSNVPYAELDFGGRTVTLLGGDSAFEYYTQSFALDGDSMNDALYNRYQNVGEKLNVTFDFACGDASFAVNKLNSTVLAGEDLYTLAMVQRETSIGKMVGDHILYDWNELPYIDLTGPYWYQDAIDSLRVDEKTFYTYGDIYPLSVHCFFSNKRLIELYDLDDPYTHVINGTWTLDVMFDEAKAVVKDLNGDGQMDDKDQYGFSFWKNDNVNSFLYGAGLAITAHENDTIVVNPCSEKMMDVYNKTLTIFENNVSFKKLNVLKIDSDQVLFYTNCVHFARQFRDSNVEFGLLPYPKYDEKQENYISFLNTELMCIPSTSDPELAGAVVQLLAENSADVKTAYYEYLLKDKISRDPESAQMLDIIFAHAVNDFAVSFAGGAKIYPLFAQMAMGHKTEFVSKYEAQIPRAEADIEKALAFIESYSAD